MDCIIVTEAYKFNGDDFDTWQKQIVFNLMRKGLWNIIEPFEDEDSISSRLQDKHKTLGIIAKNPSNEVIHHISDLKDAKQA